MEGITVEIKDGIATLELKLPGSVNTVSEPLARALDHGLTQALEVEGLRGIIIASGHRDFCVGADIDMLFGLRDPAQVLEFTTLLGGLYRKLETSGVPVVAAITGTALGGGYELALACHRRIALDDPRIQIGLPEVGLGVIPGAGGTQRLPYLMGLQASMELMAAATPVRAPKALAKGMVDALANDVDDLMGQARAWIADNPKPVQPWDQKRWTWPGGVRPGTMEAMQLFVGASAFITKRTAGAFPAAEAIVKAVSDGTKLKFDRALEMEARLFGSLAVSDQSKDMIRTLWYHRNAAEKVGVGLEHGFKKVAVLGAGMMGGGLAFLAAKAGMEVVLKDIAVGPLDAAREHCTAEARKLRHLSTDEQDAILAKITYTTELAALEGTDLVIEAIIEKLAIKHTVIREVEPLLAPDAVFASNTSAIPITMLATAAKNKDRFIGMHFFSPVEKMPLLEVIQPELCSQRTLDRALGFGKAINKTNIVVNDGYGFFTTRLFAAYLLEGCELVAQGHDPVLVEYAARTAGMVMPPLKVFDTVTLTLGVHAFENREEVMGEPFLFEGLSLVRKLVELGRTGRAVGKGFYDWDTRTIWPGLADLVQRTPKETGIEVLQRRLMISQVAEVGRVLDQGIIRERRDVDVGAIFGLGFAPNTGGPLSWMDRQGISALVDEMRSLAESHGSRYAPAPILERMADKGERFWPES